MEDIGLNINEGFNRVELSHYVLLNIPSFAKDDRTGLNDGLVLNTNMDYSEQVYKGRQGDFLLTESFENYCLNMETIVRNQDSYNYAANETVSERVFWKWLFGHLNVATLDDKFEQDGGYLVEKYDGDNEPIVKGFGSISAGAQRTDDSGIYNETFVQIPSSYGQMKVLFKKVVDENYRMQPYNGTTSELIENLSWDEVGKSNMHYRVIFEFTYGQSLPFRVGDTVTYKVPNSDYSIDLTVLSIDNHATSGITNVRCETYENAEVIAQGVSGVLTFDSVDVPYTDVHIESEDVNEVIIATNISPYFLDDRSSTQQEAKYVVDSQYDMLEVEFDINKLRTYYHDDTLTYDDIAMGKVYEDDEKYTEKYSDYKFNAILVYYSIYNSDKTKRLATNAYGLYLLDNAIEDSENSGVFYFPSLLKKKTSNLQNGSSYSFRINIKSTTAYSGDVQVADNSTAAYDMSEDFNDVLRNLTAATNILRGNTKLIQQISNDNTNVKEMVSNIMEKVDDLTTDVDNIKNGNTLYVSSKYLKEDNGGAVLSKAYAMDVLNAIRIGYHNDGSLAVSVNDAETHYTDTSKIAHYIVDQFGNDEYADCLSMLLVAIAALKG